MELAHLSVPGSTDLTQLIKRFTGSAPATTTAPAPAGRTDLAAGVTYERYELDYLKVKLIEQGIRSENARAFSSQLSVEAVKITYEKLQVNASATTGAGQQDAVAKTLNFSLTRAEYERLDVSIGKKLQKEKVMEFLREFDASLADLTGKAGKAGQAGKAAWEEEQEGLSDGQLKQLRELELLLRTFTDKSDKEIRQTVKDIAGAFRDANGRGGTPALPPDAATPATATPASASATSISAEMINIEVQVYESGAIAVREVQDPLVIDLDGDGIELTDADSGARFDLTGDGTTEQTGTVSGDDAFLAYDRNGNGQIDSGKELFGDQHGAANGFAELAKFDDNADNRIDAQDAVFSGLRLWTDRNTNGSSEAAELRTLPEAGITAINLDYQTYNLKGEKNALTEAAAVEFADGRNHAAADVHISYLA